MESILGVVILIIVFIVKAVLSSKGADAEPVMGEAFPKIDPIEPVDDCKVHAVEPLQEVITKDAKNTSEPMPIQVVETSNPKLVNPKPVVSEENRREKVEMKCKSDVRRAFLYSEIFNRKY